MANHWTDLENIRWPVSSSTKGPRRVCRFCVLGILIPIVLLCIPLYMRHRAFHPFPFTISPSDMKLLNQVRSTQCFFLDVCVFLCSRVAKQQSERGNEVVSLRK